MKTLIVAKVPTHHNSSSLRNLNLEHYNKFGSGVHQSVEDFKTLSDAKEHMSCRDVEGVASVEYLSGVEREEYRAYGYLKF